MLSRIEFLSLVLPGLSGDEHYGFLSLKHASKGATPQARGSFVQSIQTLSDKADHTMADNANAFYALASYTSASEGRYTSNAAALKSFFVDIDCDPADATKYANVHEALQNLKQFCKTTQLPKPYIVLSGLGVHAYWILEEAIPTAKWKTHATALLELCRAHAFKIDRKVTTDAARVLRIPETLHLKDPTNPLPVELVKEGELMSLGQLETLLPIQEDPLAVLDGARPNYQADSATNRLLHNTEAKFRTIIAKSLRNEGCKQILEAVENQEHTPEPLWRAVLSIAAYCVDRDKAIHIISDRHPEYSREKTERKASETKGPYTCLKFRELNPDGCEGCGHKLTSPIQLGRVLKEPLDAEPTIEATNAVTGTTEPYKIPQYPFPYKRGVNGGVYRIGADNEAELVYRNDFYIIKRVSDSDKGETVIARLHLPQDGVREFILHLSDIMTPDKFRTIIAAQGIALHPAGYKELMSYTLKWIEYMQEAYKAEISHKQFGWTKEMDAIIVGDRDIRATEIRYSPPSTTTRNIVHFMSKMGDFHVWKDIINVYARDGMEDKAFTFFMGFGSLLIKLTDLSGGMVNLYSKGSGSGKTTAVWTATSIWGHPKNLEMVKSDTLNHRMNRTGIMCNLAVVMDEITNMDPMEMSNMIYDITQGRAKDRMQQHANAERVNDTRWATCLLTTSNRSVLEALHSAKASVDGEMNRIFELHIAKDPDNNASWSTNHFGRLLTNYGHAIEPYAQYIIANQHDIQHKLLPKIRARIENDCAAVSSERYWIMLVSCAIAGGLIAKQLHLHDIPVNKIYAHGLKLIRDARVKSVESLMEHKEFLGGFIQRHFQEILVIKGETQKGMGCQIVREPRGALTIRFEVDTKLLYIVSKAYRYDCSKVGLNMDESLTHYKQVGAFIGSKSKRMAAGTASNTGAGVLALVFDTTKLDFDDIDFDAALRA